MAFRELQLIANGLRTDHPIPGLPFADDSHIPVEEPNEIEAIGRHHGEGTWGRTDRRRTGGWVAFTTDMSNKALAWVICSHPEHGRTVLLVRDSQAVDIYTGLSDPGLLFRAGDYWWDGTTWFRPPQIWDPVGEGYLRRPAPGARTVTAEEFLQRGGDPARAQILEVTSITVTDDDGAESGAAGQELAGTQDDAGPGRAPSSGPGRGRWEDDLAAWAQQRETDARPLSQCVVTLTAPELTADQLVGTAEMAKIAGVAASTLRAYIARNEAEVPQPQATISGRSAWSRPVAEEWAEQRALDVSPAAGVTGPGPAMSLGLAQIRDRYAQGFMSRLWDNPSTRKRWALRWRSEAAIRELATSLGTDAALGLRGAVPIDALSKTMRRALVDEFADGLDICRAVGEDVPAFLGITRPVARMLAWLILAYPDTAKYAVTDAIGEAQRRYNLPRAVTADSLRTAMALDAGEESLQAINDFLDKVLAPVLAGGE